MTSPYSSNQNPALGHNGRPPRSSVPVLGTVFGLFNNVWFGIFLMVCILVYASLASAGILYPTSWNVFDSDNWERFLVRGRFDKTEMEVFAWWPFNLLIALFCITLITVTLKRIRFSAVNLGVWTIHAGILTLCAGSIYYFGTKIEGDAPVFRRQAVIRIPGSGQPTILPIRPGNQLVLGEGENTYRFQVMEIIPEWPILTGDDKGKKAYTVQIAVQTATQSFVRQLLAGYPQYTEDVIPGSGRAIKTIGRALVDEALDIRLDYEPQEYLYKMDTAALYVRQEGRTDWIQRPLRGVPHYHERVASRADVWWDDPVLDPLDLASKAESPDDPLKGYDVHVTGFLPYAQLKARWVEGGDELNPVIGVRVQLTTGEKDDYELAAFHPEMNDLGGGQLSFRWVQSPEELDRLAEMRPDRLRISVPGTETDLEVVVPEQTGESEDPPFAEIEGTSYAYRVRNVARGIKGMGEEVRGKTLDVAMVEIRTPARTFTRMVASVPQATRDMSAEHEMLPTDPGIEMTFHPGNDSRGLIVAAGPPPIGIQLLVPTNSKSRLRIEAPLGQPIALNPGVSLTVHTLLERAVREVRPEVVPVVEQRPEVAIPFFLIKLEVTKGSWSQARWLEYNPHVFSSEQYASGRPYRVEHVHLPDGQSVEVMFSRERMKLPAPVVLEDFELLTHTGGFTGPMITIRDFVSRVRFATPDGWTEPMKVASNNPANFGGFWFFQATWDPPSGDSAGMNYTGLGIGNRNGVHIQLAGTALAVMGMIYAFYVKPMILRRRRESARISKTKSQPFQDREPISATVPTAPVGA